MIAYLTIISNYANAMIDCAKEVNKQVIFKPYNCESNNQDTPIGTYITYLKQSLRNYAQSKWAMTVILPWNYTK